MTMPVSSLRSDIPATSSVHFHYFCALYPLHITTAITHHCISFTYFLQRIDVCGQVSRDFACKQTRGKNIDKSIIVQVR